jgi:hypothetical protein
MLGIHARLTTLLCKKKIYILLQNPMKRKPDGLIQTNVEESPEEGYD